MRWRRALRLALSPLDFLVVALPGLVFMLLGFFYATRIAGAIDQDTTQVTNLAFGVAATLAALCFSGARAINDHAETSDRFTYSGERFLHAALLTITSSLMKYAALESGARSFEDLSQTWAAMVVVLTVSSAGLLFLASLVAQDGAVVVGRLLRQRAMRYPDADSFW